MIIVHSEIRYTVHQRFQELIGGEEIVKTGERDRILNSGIVSVKSDEIGNSHVAELFERDGAVQRFSLGTSVLAAFIQEGHDDIDPVGLAVGSGDDPLQILKMIVRGHMVHVSADRVGKTVVGDIHHDEKIGPTYRFIDITFTFAGSETGTFAVHQEGFFGISPGDQVTVSFGDQLFTETDELTVDFLRKFPAAGQSRNADRSYRDRFFEKFSIRHDILQK